MPSIEYSLDVWALLFSFVCGICQVSHNTTALKHFVTWYIFCVTMNYATMGARSSANQNYVAETSAFIVGNFI